MAGNAVITPKLATLIERYRTCELLTVSKSGVPIPWPTSGILDPANGTFVISTSIGFPQKAFNIRRDPRVALLFSNPTGSSLDAPEQVLVQGMAECPDEVVSGFSAHAALWRRLLSIQPSSRPYSRFGATRRLMDMYYMRLYITVTPTRALSRPALVEGGPLAAPGVRRGRKDALGSTLEEWRHYGSAVLACFDESGAPTLARVDPRLDGDSFVLEAPGGTAEGPASLLTHRHDAKLAGMRSAVVTGTLARVDGGWRFSPQRFVPGGRPLGPATLVALIRGMRANAARYLARRGLARPAVAWAELAEIEKTLPGSRAR